MRIKSSLPALSLRPRRGSIGVMLSLAALAAFSVSRASAQTVTLDYFFGGATVSAGVYNASISSVSSSILLTSGVQSGLVDLGTLSASAPQPRTGGGINVTRNLSLSIGVATAPLTSYLQSGSISRSDTDTTVNVFSSALNTSFTGPNAGTLEISILSNSVSAPGGGTVNTPIQARFLYTAAPAVTGPEPGSIALLTLGGLVGVGSLLRKHISRA